VLALLHRYNAIRATAAPAGAPRAGYADEGILGLHRGRLCSVVLPKGVDPANAINQNKMASAINYFTRFVSGKGAQNEHAGRPEGTRPGGGGAKRPRGGTCRRAASVRPVDGRLVEARFRISSRTWRAKPPPVFVAAYAIVLLGRPLSPQPGQAAWDGWCRR
jgi:hypothetical protein